MPAGLAAGTLLLLRPLAPVIRGEGWGEGRIRSLEDSPHPDPLPMGTWGEGIRIEIMPKLKILFLCTGNSCRSQMAEGWARHLKGQSIEPYSAGIETHGLNP